MFEKLYCLIRGHWYKEDHDFLEIVICDTCGVKIKAQYDFIRAWYVKA